MKKSIAVLLIAGTAIGTFAVLEPGFQLFFSISSGLFLFAGLSLLQDYKK